MDGAKCPSEWDPQALAEQLPKVLVAGGLNPQV